MNLSERRIPTPAVHRVAPVELVAVVIPARNEEERVAACLAGVRRAGERCPATVRTIVVLDGCVDGTAAVVRGFEDVETLEVDFASVGLARAAGVSWLMSTSAAPLDQTWLAHTDADSCPDPEWLATMVRLADTGTQMVLGTVGLEAADVELCDLWSSQHELVEGHPYVHGANFGIRASAYVEVGGFPPLRTGEDVLLAERTERRFPGRTVRTASIPTATSARLQGRAPDGMAGYLASLQAGT